MQTGKGKDHSKEINKAKDLMAVQQAARILADVSRQGQNSMDPIVKKKRRKKGLNL